MKRRIIKTSVLMILVLVFALSLVSQSQAQKHRPIPGGIKGTYATMGYDSCVSHWTYNPNDPVDVHRSTYWTKTTTFQGTTTFDQHGNGASEVDQVTMTYPTYTPIPLGPYFSFPSWPQPPGNLPLGGISTSHSSSTFTYSVDTSTRVITQVVHSTGQFISGGPPGAMYITVEPDETKTGYISLDAGTIIGTTSESAVIRTVNFWQDEAHTQLVGTQEDRCQRSRILTLISK